MKATFRQLAALLLSVYATLAMPRVAQAQDSKPETRSFTFSQCPTTGPAVYVQHAKSGLVPLVAALVSAVVSPLIEGVVDKGVDALKDAAKDKDFPIASPDPLVQSFYQVGPSGETSVNKALGCVVLVRGEFEKGMFSASDVREGTSLPERIEAKLRAPAGAGASQQPGDPYIRVKPGTLEFYFEVVPVLSDERKTLGFRPQALYVDHFASKDGLFGPNHRNYQFTVTFADQFGAQAFASADFKYEGIEEKFSKEACTGKAASDYCAATELGGIRGWYATKPISDDFAPVIKSRQANAITLKTAQTAWVNPPERAKVPDDLPAVSAKLDVYCTALEAANKPKLAGQQEWDETCPAKLAVAKRDYLYAHAIAASRLEKQSADELWTKKCRDASGELQKTDENLVKCLKILNGGQEVIAAGKFLLTSTIVEIRPGNKVAAFLAPAAEKVAPTIKTDLEQKFDPVDRAKAAAAAASLATATAKTKGDALAAVALADDNVKAAQITYSAAVAAQAGSPNNEALEVASINAHIALVTAQSAANDAYRAASLPVPFPVVG